MTYGASQRRSRAGLISLASRGGTYPIRAYPIQGSAAVYANPAYGSVESETEYGWLLPLLTTAAGALSNHFLASDAQAANAQAQANAQQIAALEAANKPYLYLGAAFVLGAMVLGIAAVGSSKKKTPKTSMA